jgi:hypothetical protein
MLSDWKDQDPRHAINKRDTIVIVRPDPVTGGHWQAGMGEVDTKNGWSIVLSGLEPRRLIDESDTWPEGWLWTRAPGYLR